MNDLRFALRQLWKNPAFTLVAALSLALGIGANSTLLTSSQARDASVHGRLGTR